MTFRKTIHDGDLILEKRFDPLPIVPFFGKWLPYRNESEETRLLKEHMDRAFMHYKEMQRLYVVAQKNVETDKQLLQMYQMDNSEVQYTVPNEQSILEEREGIKYSFNKGNSGKQNNQSNGNGNNQQQQQKQKGGTQQPRRVSLLSILAGAEITMPQARAN